MKQAVQCALALAIGALTVTATSMAQSQDAQLQSPDCSISTWIASGQPFCLSLPADAPTSGLRVFLGRSDVSPWFRVDEARRLHYVPGVVSLPAGEHDVVVRAPTGAGWREVTRSQLRILTARGFEKRAAQSGFALSVDSTPAAGAGGSEDVSASPRITSVGGQATLGYELARSGALWNVEAELVGASRRGATLRYSQLGARAPRVDLGQFSTTLVRGATEARLGHLQAGRHPLLLSEFDSRGVTLRHRFGRVVDVAFARVNASTIVGFDNPLGFTDPRHRLDTMTAGVELRPQQPGALRVELSWLNGSHRPIDDFGAGEISDSERSRGLGLRLVSAAFDQRLLTEITVARSRFENPADELLSQGDEIVAVRTASARAHVADLRWLVLRPGADAERALQLALHLHHERADPLYRSIGADVRADAEQTSLGVETSFGALAFSALAQRQDDNLDNIPTILSTGTETQSLRGELDLPSVDRFRAWPAISFRWQRQRQFARNAPESFLPTHLPDQVTAETAVGLSWTAAHWEWSLELIDDRQDNRQPGRERADQSDFSQELGVRYAPTDSGSIGVGVSRVRAFNTELAQSQYTHAGWLAAEWQFARHWRFSGRYSFGRDFDSLDLASEHTATLQSEISANFDLRGFGAALPMQMFLRHAATRGSSIDRVFDLRSATSDWQVTTGFNVGLK